MSGLLDAVARATHGGAWTSWDEDAARAAVEAVAAWLEGRKDCDLAHEVLRAEVAPPKPPPSDERDAEMYRAGWEAGHRAARAQVAPPKPTPEDVIREACGPWPNERHADAIANALRDAGMLRHTPGTPS